MLKVPESSGRRLAVGRAIPIDVETPQIRAGVGPRIGSPCPSSVFGQVRAPGVRARRPRRLSLVLRPAIAVSPITANFIGWAKGATNMCGLVASQRGSSGAIRRVRL